MTRFSVGTILPAFNTYNSNSECFTGKSAVAISKKLWWFTGSLFLSDVLKTKKEGIVLSCSLPIPNFLNASDRRED